MLKYPMTKEQAQEYRYGTWAGNPKGHAYDPKRCAAEVCCGFHFYQCSRQNGHGVNGLYCRQHARKVKPATGKE